MFEKSVHRCSSLENAPLGIICGRICSGPKGIRDIQKEKKMKDEATTRKLQQDEDIAYFRTDL